MSKTTIPAGGIGADAIDATKIADDAISEEHIDPTAITASTEKSTLVAADKFLIADSAASNAIKYVQQSNLGSGSLVKLTQANSLTDASVVNIDSSFKIADSLNNNNYNALHLDMLLYPYNNTGVANIGSIDNASVIVYQSHYWNDGDGGERQEQVSGGGTYTQTTVPDGFGFDLSSGDFDGYNYALFGYKG